MLQGYWRIALKRFHSMSYQAYKFYFFYTLISTWTFFDSEYAIILSSNDYRSHASLPSSVLFFGFVSNVKDLNINTVVPLYNVQLEDLYSFNRTKYWITLLTWISGRTVSAMSSIAFNALKFNLLQEKSSVLKYEPFKECWHLPESSIFDTGRRRGK